MIDVLPWLGSLQLGLLWLLQIHLQLVYRLLSIATWQLIVVHKHHDRVDQWHVGPIGTHLRMMVNKWFPVVHKLHFGIVIRLIPLLPLQIKLLPLISKPHIAISFNVFVFKDNYVWSSAHYKSSDQCQRTTDSKNRPQRWRTVDNNNNNKDGLWWITEWGHQIWCKSKRVFFLHHYFKQSF